MVLEHCKIWVIQNEIENVLVLVILVFKHWQFTTLVAFTHTKNCIIYHLNKGDVGTEIEKMPQVSTLLDMPCGPSLDIDIGEQVL